jgi:transcriptional regulator with XRE-family HTH domain
LQLGHAFGKTLKEFRRNLGMTQEELALRAGIAPNFISLLERGEKSPSLDTAFRISEAMDIRAEVFIEDVARRRIVRA